MAGRILLLGADDETARLVRHGLDLMGETGVEEVGRVEEVVAGLEAGDDIDGVCVVAPDRDPVAAVQRIHQADPDVGVVVVAEADRCEAVRKALRLAPFVGPDAVCHSIEDAQLLGVELGECASRTRRRRTHRRTMQAAMRTLAQLEPRIAQPAKWLGSLMEQAPIGVVLLDVQGRVRSWNRRASELFEKREADVAGRPLADLFEGEEAGRLRRLVARSAAGEQGARDPELLRRSTAGGEEQWLEARLTVMLDRASQPEAMVILQDVTARLLAERARDAAERELRRSHALLTAIVDSTPDPIYVKDVESRYLLMNAAGAAVANRRVEEVIGRTPADLFPPETARVMLADDARVREKRSAEAFEEEVRTAETSRVFLSTKAPLFDDDGKLLGVVGISRDITDRKRAEEHARFLAEASEVMASSLDYHETLAHVARIAVPTIADWCVVDMLGEDGTVQRLAVAHADPEKEALGWELSSRYPPDLAAETGLGLTLRTGRLQLFPEIPDELLEQVARDEEHLRLLRSFGLTSAIVVPVRSPDRILGALTFATSGPARLGAEKLQLVQELARRASVAIENARLHAERLHIATTLQQSLLPPVLPDVPGMAVAARYLAAGSGNEVGGDFYDLFELDDGSWLAVIGDVCGKGAKAAAVTALARYTIRAVAMREGDPVAILSALNDALLRQRSIGDYCTVAIARLQTAEARARATVASGGHPLPLVLRSNGSAAPVGVVGTLLGVVPDSEFGSASVELEPGDALLLYTDGITEARAPRRVLDPDDLAEAVRTLAGSDAGVIAERLEALAVEGEARSPRDDIAVLVLTVPGGRRPAAGPLSAAEVTREIPAGARVADDVRDALTGLAPALEPQLFHDVRLVATELAVNAVRHGTQAAGEPLVLRVRVDSERVRIEVADPGPGFDRPEIMPEPTAAGGWGLRLVDALAASWGVVRGGQSRVWAELQRGTLQSAAADAGAT